MQSEGRTKMRESLIGKRFGKLVVVEQVESSPSGASRWLCQCDCGNQRIVLGYNLNRGTTVSCGCKRYRDLTGQRIGKLQVLERSNEYASRGERKQQLWKCLCDCGTITYKATDTLTNGDISMCQKCAQIYAAEQARANAGYVGKTQLSKIRVTTEESDNLSGVRGVYLDLKTGKYRARIRFQGTTYDLGSYVNLVDAIKARRLGEEEYFGTFLDSVSSGSESENQ